jgi:hypothetical protein
MGSQIGIAAHYFWLYDYEITTTLGLLGKSLSASIVFILLGLCAEQILDETRDYSA